MKNKYMVALLVMLSVVAVQLIFDYAIDPSSLGDPLHNLSKIISSALAAGVVAYLLTKKNTKND